MKGTYWIRRPLESCLLLGLVYLLIILSGLDLVQRAKAQDEVITKKNTTVSPKTGYCAPTAEKEDPKSNYTLLCKYEIAGREMGLGESPRITKKLVVCITLLGFRGQDSDCKKVLCLDLKKSNMFWAITISVLIMIVIALIMICCLIANFSYYVCCCWLCGSWKEKPSWALKGKKKSTVAVAPTPTPSKAGSSTTAAPAAAAAAPAPAPAPVPVPMPPPPAQPPPSSA